MGFLKYSFAFERKDEYKACYYKLEESIVKWKTKAELEENRRLKLNINYLQSEQEIEAAEGRTTELMVELTSIRLKHDTEINSIKESYEKLIKEEKKKKEQLDKDVAEKNVEIKKQRKVYGEKMNEVRTRLDEARAEETIIKGKLIASEITRKELDTN